MGNTAEIVRSVFSKSRSFQKHETYGHESSGNGVEKRKWSSSVRSYLCGDERSSVLAAEDSAEVDLYSFRSNRATNSSSTVGGEGDMITSVYAEDDTVSVRSSEATVNQPHHGDSKDEISRKEKQNSAYRLFQQEDAAFIIQSAFRSFLARRARDGGDEKNDDGTASSSRESIGTSIEVQTGNSSHIFSESFRARQTMRQRTTAQVLKIQEEWDDSTVSSVISKMRTRNRLEAATRRERALAYAFSQQLRICSKKKQITSNGDETNTGWSWLERWMAARQPEIRDMNISRVRKRMLDAAMEEKESCGSNEVCSLVEANNLYPTRNVPRPSKIVIRSKATRSFSRQNSASSHLCPTESKDAKKVCHLEDEKEKRKRPKQPGNKRDIKNGATQLVQHEIEQ
ncbi:hypothetical protein DH2020_049481 [Rehmannia glutinosa]|uniref:Protein IQ-DOMAIN 1 n=1 Tax=Rehmannia glutinosa TaxID=99300 RepID=A0ABR0U2N7_REHGL